MADYKQLFGYAAIIFSAGFLVRSFTPAHALNGPNTSLGSNPHFNYIENGWSATLSTYTLSLPIASDQVAIIENVSVSGSSYCAFSLNGQEIDLSVIKKLKVEPTDTIGIMKRSNTGASSCGSGTSSYNKIYIEGYYSQL